MFVRKVLFRDEATFLLNDHINRQTYRYWSKKNPHCMDDTNKLNVGGNNT